MPAVGSTVAGAEEGGLDDELSRRSVWSANLIFSFMSTTLPYVERDRVWEPRGRDMIGIAWVCYESWSCCVKGKSDLSILSRLSDPLRPGTPDHTTTGEEYQLFDDG